MRLRLGVAVVAAAAMLLTSGAAVRAQEAHGGQGAAPQATPAAAGTAGDRFKNVRVLKDIPAEQLLPTMQFIAASLGVECDYCHVQGAFEKDDRKEKQTARRMIGMVLAIDRDNFDGDRDVTCYSCHRGSPKPEAIPAVATTEGRREPEVAAATPALPSADQLLERWAQASGGDALAKVTSRLQKGQLIGFGGQPLPVEVVAKAPGKRMSVVRSPRGEMVTAFDGIRGWLTGRDGPHPMSAAEAEAAKLDADLALPLHAKSLFTGFSVRPSGKVGDRDAVLLVAAAEGRPPVRFYLDAQSGLLLREERYAQTALGLMPTRIDYGDYRDVDGVKVAFRWTLARPNGLFTIQVESTRQNVPVDDARFAMPAPRSAAGAPTK